MDNFGLNINGNWDKKKTKLLGNFSELTNEDLNYIEGEESLLIQRIRIRLRISEDIAKKLIRYS